MCHLNLGNHKKAFDDILRADVLDSGAGEFFCRSMEFPEATDSDNPRSRTIAQLYAALEKRKKDCLKVRLSLHVLSRCPMLRQIKLQ